MPETPQETEQTERQRVNLDLDRLVERYGKRLAQADLATEVAIQRAERAEGAVRELAQRVARLEDEKAHREIVEAEEAFEESLTVAEEIAEAEREFDERHGTLDDTADDVEEDAA